MLTPKARFAGKPLAARPLEFSCWNATHRGRRTKPLAHTRTPGVVLHHIPHPEVGMVEAQLALRSVQGREHLHRERQGVEVMVSNRQNQVGQRMIPKHALCLLAQPHSPCPQSPGTASPARSGCCGTRGCRLACTPPSLQVQEGGGSAEGGTSATNSTKQRGSHERVNSASAATERSGRDTCLLLRAESNIPHTAPAVTVNAAAASTSVCMHALHVRALLPPL
jgi:hypothetical protein